MCKPSDPVGCGTEIIGGIASSAAVSAWDAVCQSFAEAAVDLLKAFSAAFLNAPAIDVEGDGVGAVFSMSVTIAAIIAAVVVLIQAVRTAVAHEGNPLATAVVGLGKALLAMLLTTAMAGAGLSAADAMATWIVDQTWGGEDELQDKLAAVMLAAPGQQATLVFILAVVGIILTLVLWFEILLCNAAVAVLVGTSPIAASGLLSEKTQAAWTRLVNATIQLTVLKPVVALVFAIGFTVTGESDDIGSTLAGAVVLLLAVLAWPAIARFFPLVNVQFGGGSGLASVVGFSAGRASEMSAGSGASGGENGPDRWGEAAAARSSAMAGHGGVGQMAPAGAGRAAGSASAVAGEAGLGPLGVAAAGLTMAQRAANSVTGHMEQIAGHAGLSPHNPHPHPAGYPHSVPLRPASRRPGGAGRAGGDGHDDPETGPGSEGSWPDQLLPWDYTPGEDDAPAEDSAVRETSSSGEGGGPAGPGGSDSGAGFAAPPAAQGWRSVMPRTPRTGQTPGMVRSAPSGESPGQDPSAAVRRQSARDRAGEPARGALSEQSEQPERSGDAGQDEGASDRVLRRRRGDQE